MNPWQTTWQAEETLNGRLWACLQGTDMSALLGGVPDVVWQGQTVPASPPAGTNGERCQVLVTHQTVSSKAPYLQTGILQEERVMLVMIRMPVGLLNAHQKAVQAGSLLQTVFSYQLLDGGIVLKNMAVVHRGLDQNAHVSVMSLFYRYHTQRGG